MSLLECFKWNNILENSAFCAFVSDALAEEILTSVDFFRLTVIFSFEIPQEIEKVNSVLGMSTGIGKSAYALEPSFVKIGE